MKLRNSTKEETELHTKELTLLYKDKIYIEEGFKQGLISKSQMKKGLAENFNKKNEYMIDNGLWVVGKNIFIWENK